MGETDKEVKKVAKGTARKSATKRKTTKPKTSKAVKAVKRTNKPKAIKEEDKSEVIDINTDTKDTFTFDIEDSNEAPRSGAEKVHSKMGRPRKFTSAIDMYAEGMTYFDERERNKKPITITGLCLALETTRSVLMDYENGKYDDDLNDFSYTVKRLKMMVEDGYEQKLHGTTAAGAIFALKNFGWRDVVDVNTNKQPDELTNEDIQDLISRKNKRLKRIK